MPKLTLSADREVIRQAKKLARENRTSISAMFARFIRLAAIRGKVEEQLGPITRRATGLGRLPEGKTDREVLEEALMEKYGLK